jgi:hypothetical protein
MEGEPLPSGFEAIRTIACEASQTIDREPITTHVVAITLQINLC